MDMQHQLSQDEVATLLNVSIDTLKQWRTARLAGTQLALVPTGDLVDRSRRYTQDDLVEWLVKNPARLALLQFASEERRALLPLAMAAQHAPTTDQPTPEQPVPEQQRSPASAGKGLLGIASHADNLTPATA